MPTALHPWRAGATDLRPLDVDEPDFARLPVRQAERQNCQHHMHLVTDGVDHRRYRILVWDVDDVHVSHALEAFSHKVLRRAVPRLRAWNWRIEHQTLERTVRRGCRQGKVVLLNAARPTRPEERGVLRIRREQTPDRKVAHVHGDRAVQDALKD